MQNGLYKRVFKRPLDVSFSLIMIVVLLPLLLILALLVKVNVGSPVIFKHKRPGLNENIFIIYKFRTMTNEKDKNGGVLPDEARLTKFGKFLRVTSLDELPELINILCGNLSFIGPRPLEVYFLPYYNEREKHRHDLSPGLTGLAQINGRNDLSWEQRFQYDLEYIQHITFINDLKILFKTIVKVHNREGTTFCNEDFNDQRERQIKEAESQL